MKITDNENNEAVLDAATFRMLSRRSPLPWLRDCLLDWAVIMVVFYATGIWNHPLGYLAALFVIGNRQHALAILGHDGTHFSVTKKRWANDAVTNLLAFWPIGLTVTGYRNLHFQHHKHTNTRHDPELQHRSAKAPQWDLPVTLPKILKYAALDIVGYSITDYLMIVAFARPDKKRDYIWMACFHAVLIVALVAAGLWWVPVLWYAAVTTTFMMFFRLRTWLEHQGSDGTHRIHLNLWQRIILSPHFAWLHYEHHNWPSVPYYNLPILRKYIHGEPTITLQELIRDYECMPQIVSGQPLKQEITTVANLEKEERALAA